MELGLSLGDVSKSFGFLKKNRKINNKGLTFCVGSEVGFNGREEEEEEDEDGEETEERRVSVDQLVQLDLLPLVPLHRNSETCSGLVRGFDVNRSVEIEDGCNEIDNERASSRASDEEENGLIRKKLRLSKEQSAFLEESFKEHNTLNPKQKLALAKQLKLRPRQVEVWFQNRRARTKLKQTEVDCEYLKRCCETLTEENKRLQKELQELRTLKTSNNFYAHLPATTLTMCPSCERVSTNKHRLYPLSQSHAHQSTAS